MKKSIIKNFVVFFASTLLLFTMPLTSFALDQTEYISPNTLITPSNIIDVMNYLELDVDKLILTPQEDGCSSLTVGDLQRKVEKDKNQNIHSISKTEYYCQENVLTRASSIRTKMVYATDEYDPYKLTYSVGIKYEHCNAGTHIWEQFLDVTSMDVSVSGKGLNIATKYKITSKSMNGAIKDGGKKAEINSSVKVTSYLTVAFAEIPMNTINHNSTHYFYAQTIN